jgi:hypothetical protein
MKLLFQRYFFSISNLDKIVFFGSGKVAFPSLKVLSSKFPNLSVITHHSPSDKKITNEV